MSLFAHELRAQQVLFWRTRESAFFTFLLPIILLVLLTSVYGDETIDGVRGSTYLVAGLLGYGVIATAFAGVAITMVVRRESGILKRVRGTPLPASVYLAAVVASTLVVIALEAVAQVLIGRYLLGAQLPAAPVSLALVLLLGGVAFAALGLGFTGLIRSDEGASAVVNAIYLPVVLISGSFFSLRAMPEVLEAVAEVLPLAHLLRLLRTVFVDGDPAWSSPGSLAVVLAWGVVGVALAVRMFRWEPREA